MRVAYLVNQYPHTSHSFIRREVAALERQGVTVERFSVRPPPAKLVDPADQAEQQRTAVLLASGALGLLGALLATALAHPVRWGRAFFLTVRLGRRSERGVLRHIIYLAEACLLRRRLQQCGATHLHAHFGTNSASVALLTRVLGGPPYSFTVHGPEEFDRPEAISLGDKIERAAFVVAISEFGRSQLFRWCAYPHWAKVHVVRCGVDAGFLSGGPQPVSDTTQLVCVGRLAEQKGQLVLLEALGQLAAEGLPFRMTLAGDGPMRSIIEERIRRLGLEAHVRITGWVSNDTVRQEMVASRVFVLPSFAEGLPVVLMEALALGRPAVTTYVAGIPELVEPGVNGWLIPAGSVAALAGVLREALRTPLEQLQRMGRAGSERVQLQHDANKEAEKLARLFAAQSSPESQPSRGSVGQ
jgi:glycosyltransferase involved in cell wall biosynthesis